MTSAILDPKVLGVLIPLSAIWGGIILAAILIIKDSSGKGRESNPDETRMIQDVYHGLMKMEERVESLETLMVERERERGVK